METYDNGRVFAAELFGTTVLMIGGPGTAIFAGDQVGTLGVALAFGFSLLVIAYIIGHASGAHVNPAVTLAALLAKKITPAHAVFAWVAQLIGGALGGLIIYGIASGRDTFQRGQFAANLWSGQYFGLGSTIIVEVLLTALLVVVVLSTAGPRFPTGFGGLTVGLTLALIHLISIPVDNTSVNPARSFGTAIFAETRTHAFEQLWAFFVFPLIGGVVGVIIWLMIDDSRLEDTLLAELPGAIDLRDRVEIGLGEAEEALEDSIDGDGSEVP
jgi:aquaporin Z